MGRDYKNEVEILLLELQKVTNSWYKEKGLTELNIDFNNYVSVAIYNDSVSLNVDPKIDTETREEIDTFILNGEVNEGNIQEEGK